MLEAGDQDQAPQRGGWLQASYGNGTYTYLAYALHRQLPNGVPGAYRLLANVLAGDLPADGVVTGVGRVHGRPEAIMANDSTVKAGSWGARTVEKIIRIQETAMRYRIPLVYLVDSAGARITDQIEMFPGRRHAGHIFQMQCKLSGLVPQVCLLFGPSAAGGCSTT